MYKCKLLNYQSTSEHTGLSISLPLLNIRKDFQVRLMTQSSVQTVRNSSLDWVLKDKFFPMLKVSFKLNFHVTRDEVVTASPYACYSQKP